MNVRVAKWWESLRTSYWVMPALMCTGAVLLAFLTQEIDQRITLNAESQFRFLYSGGPDGARAVLSTIAGSMITVAGVTFSITIVALATASSQFGPRILRNFMRDTANQIVLGTFLATFVYCLMVLRTVRGVDDFRFVPQVSVFTGLVLALLSISVLIYFIHHIAESLHVSSVIDGVGRELEDEIEEIFPETVGQTAQVEPDRESGCSYRDRPTNVIESTVSGYIVGIDDGQLIRLAQQHDAVLELIERPGSFIFPGCPLIKIYPRSSVDEELTHELNSAILVQVQRTPTQDIGFLFDELVEIALRALSPGVNDPQTAITCIHWLSAGFSKLGQRRPPSEFRYDEEHELRVITVAVTFEGLFKRAFDQLTHAARRDGYVLGALMKAMLAIAPAVEGDQQRKALLDQAAMLNQTARDLVRNGAIVGQIQRHYQELLGGLADRAI